MSESKGIENLSVELQSILQTLTQFLSTHKANPLLDKATTVKKHPKMTYHDYLRSLLQSKQPVAISSVGQSYCLQEDLELLLALANYQEITKRTFDQIAAKKRINRSAESLRCRYKDHLQKVGEENMKKIIKWVQTQGVEGYISFKDLSIVLSIQDTKAVKVEDKKKKERNPSLEQAERKVEKKSGKRKAVPTNCVELNNIMKVYTKMVNLPIKTLLRKLDEASGDFVILDNFVEKQEDGKNLWTAEEDDILRSGGVEMQLLIKYKSESSVNQRRKYLGVE